MPTQQLFPTLVTLVRRRIVVSYINDAGVEEKGIDVGGLFKDYWSDLSAVAFSPGYSLFASAEGGALYPR